MLNLFDYLTEEDNRKIKNFICSYGVPEKTYIGNEEYLKYWAESNKKLFHLLGGKLIHKIPFTYEFSDDELEKLLVGLAGDGFWDRLFLAVNQIDGLSQEEVRLINRLYSASAFTNDKVEYPIKIKLPSKNKTLQIQVGMKPIRAISKLINYFFPDDQEIQKEFERIRIKHSMILNEKTLHGDLCLSIHPLDFLTMSDNDSSWQSCMSWVNDGCYRIGTVEMMNSNNVICAYLESSSDFSFGKPGYEDTWNNKKWRQLFYCTKEIIVSGKAYPFQNYQMTETILKELRHLAEVNWNHTYEYGIEEYQDMAHIGTNYRMEQNRRWIRYGNVKKHNIIFDTRGMYNDMLNDHAATHYYCVRNKVKKNTIISYSGKAPCLCCGREALRWQSDFYEEDDYNERYTDTGQLMCEDCLESFTCDICNCVSKDLLVGQLNGRQICTDCWNKLVKICPDCGKPFIQKTRWTPQKTPFIRLTEDCLTAERRYNESEYHYGELLYVRGSNFVENSMVAYQCCPACAEKLLKTPNDLFQKMTYTDCFDDDYDGVFSKEVYSPTSDFVEQHITAGLKPATRNLAEPIFDFQ
jgi:hypothetical protein